MDQQPEPVDTRPATRDGLAAVAITMLTIALIAFVISRIV
jgi:hypothetical protein